MRWRRRAFLRGVTPGRWRQQRALLLALEQLAMGASVKNVASTAGYRTPSAFIAAFRKSFGITPARYFSVAGERTRSGASLRTSNGIGLEFRAVS